MFSSWADKFWQAASLIDLREVGKKLAEVKDIAEDVLANLREEYNAAWAWKVAEQSVHGLGIDECFKILPCGFNSWGCTCGRGCWSNVWCSRFKKATGCGFELPADLPKGGLVIQSRG